MSIVGSDSQTLGAILVGGGARVSASTSASRSGRSARLWLSEQELRDAPLAIGRFTLIALMFGLGLGALMPLLQDATMAALAWGSPPWWETISPVRSVLSIAGSGAAWSLAGWLAARAALVQACRMNDGGLRRAALLTVVIAPLVQYLLWLPEQLWALAATLPAGASPLLALQHFDPLHILLAGTVTAALHLPLVLVLLPLQYAGRHTVLRHLRADEPFVESRAADVEPHPAFRSMQTGLMFAAASVVLGLPLVLSAHLLLQVAPNLAQPGLRFGLVLPLVALSGWLAWRLCTWMGSRILSASSLPWAVALATVSLLPALLVAALALWGTANAVAVDVADPSRLFMLPYDVFTMFGAGAGVGGAFISAAGFWLFAAVAPLVIVAHLLCWRALRQDDGDTA